MAVRDLLWGCPICRTPGGIRRSGRHERCGVCGARFRRGRGARIVANTHGGRQERTAAEWLSVLGPVEAPVAGPDGVILGPERVRVKVTRDQKPLHYGGQLLGWVELYAKEQTGTVTLRQEGLFFQPDAGTRVLWAPNEITGLQPASSALQVGLHKHMASVKFVEGSVRLWTRAVSDVLREHYRRTGRDVLELQPFVRTCLLTSNSP